jgi:hypothetical protein
MLNQIAKIIQDEVTSGESSWDTIALRVLNALRQPSKAMVDAVSFHSGKYSAEPTTDGQWLIVDLHRSSPGKKLADPDEAHDLAADLGSLDAINAMIDEAIRSD